MGYSSSKTSKQQNLQIFNLSCQDSSHTCLSFPPKKKKHWQALRKVTGLPNFSETHFETGAKEYLQFQTPEKKNKVVGKSPWISVKGTLNFLNHHQHHPSVTFPRHFHQDVQGGNKGPRICSPGSHQVHPPEISMLRDFCGTKSTLQKMQSIRSMIIQQTSMLLQISCKFQVVIFFNLEDPFSIKSDRLGALSKQYLIVGRAASIRWVLVITLGSWRIQTCPKTARRHLKNST